MNKVTHISIGGFRRLKSVSITTRPLMVLIGANGVGKTSVLDAISFLSASAHGKMGDKLSEMGGVADVLTRGNGGGIELGAKMEVAGNEPLTYEISVEPKGQGYSIGKEVLCQVRPGFGRDNPFKHIDSQHGNGRYYDTAKKGLVSPEWDHNTSESTLSQVPKMFREPEEMRKVIGSITQYHVLDVGSRAPVKLPQQMKPALFPGANGEDLLPFLYNLRESDRGRYEIIEDTLKSAFPGFETLNFPPVAAGMLSLTWKDKQFNTPIYMHQLSEGTLRFLWLVALLQSPVLSTITMIDEPETSLHPELLSMLVELMREASNRTQLVVATHSDRLIRFLEPREVAIMDIDEHGYAATTWADTLDLDKWLDEYSLDEVWRLGRMGGRA